MAASEGIVGDDPDRSTRQANTSVPSSPASESAVIPAQATAGQHDAPHPFAAARAFVGAHPDAVSIALAAVSVVVVIWALWSVVRVPSWAVIVILPVVVGLSVAAFRVGPAVPVVTRIDRAIESRRRRRSDSSSLLGRYAERPFLALFGMVTSASAAFGVGAVAAGLRLAGYALVTGSIAIVTVYAVLFAIGLALAVAIVGVGLWLALRWFGIEISRPSLPTRAAPGFPGFGQQPPAVPLVDTVVAVVDKDGFLSAPGLAGVPLGRIHPDGRVEGPEFFGPQTHVIDDDGRIYTVDGIVREPTSYRLGDDGRIYQTGLVDVPTGLKIERSD